MPSNWRRPARKPRVARASVLLGFKSPTYHVHGPLQLQGDGLVAKVFSKVVTASFTASWLLDAERNRRPKPSEYLASCVCKLATTTGQFLQEVPSLPDATSSTLYGPLSKRLSGTGFTPDLSLNKAMEPNIARCKSHIRPQQSLGAPGCFHRCVSGRTALPEVARPPATWISPRACDKARTRRSSTVRL